MSFFMNNGLETYKSRMSLLFVALVLVLIVGGIIPIVMNSESLDQITGLSTFKSMLISILLEALPFLLLGILVSSIMQVFIPERWIRKIIPKNPVAGVIIASLLGIIFPVCECGLIPVVRRLMAKGMPLYAGVAFILAGPIINPVVFSATYAAFRGRPEMVYSRMGLAMLVSCIIGLIVYYFVKHNPLRQLSEPSHSHSTHTNEEHAHKGNKLHQILKHSGDEFFDMGKYLILGTIITALIQTYVPRSELIAIGQGDYVSHFFMLAFAFILSLCSTSDAFVASSFVSTFSASSLLTFLVFGPMIDFKGTLMLLSIFKMRFVLFLAVAVAIVVVAGSLLVGSMFLW